MGPRTCPPVLYRVETKTLLTPRTERAIAAIDGGVTHEEQDMVLDATIVEDSVEAVVAAAEAAEQNEIARSICSNVK